MISTREAQTSDYRQLMEIYHELDELHRLRHPELFQLPAGGVSRDKAYMESYLHDKNKHIVVAEMNNAIVGFAEAFVMHAHPFPIFRKRLWVQLDNLAVKKEHQQHGVGTLLLKSIMKWAKSKGIRRIELQVYAFNNNAEAFYKKNGFQELHKSMYFNL